MIMHQISKLEIIRNQLSDLRFEIASLNIEEKHVPELIEKANLLRQNELLKKLSKKTTLLLDVYLSYIEILEQITLKSNSSEKKSSRNKKKSRKKKTKKTSKQRITKKTKKVHRKITKKLKIRR
tara:strand:+ start:5666 stop:6037 length:372 start_codon:yes stop_codon:yes gene_type:complete